MGKLTLKEMVNEKLEAEYSKFITELAKKKPNEIIEASYEKVFKQDLLLVFSEWDFSDEQLRTILELKSPLDQLYNNWLDTDYSYMEMLSDSVDDFMTKLNKH